RPLDPFFSSLLRRRPPLSTLFPYTTLFRSAAVGYVALCGFDRVSVVTFPDISQEPANESGLKTRSQELAARGALRSVRGRKSARSEEHTSELQSLRHLVCRLLLEKKKNNLL